MFDTIRQSEFEAVLVVWIEQLPAETRNRLAKLDILDGRMTSGGKPLAEHLADFRQSLLDKGGTRGHADLKTAGRGALLTAAGSGFSPILFSERSFVFWPMNARPECPRRHRITT